MSACPPPPIPLWSLGLAAGDLAGMPLVAPEAPPPAGRHVAISRGRTSCAVRRGDRLDLVVATGDEEFAAALIAAFALPPGQPAATAPASRDLMALAGRVARSSVPVLIEGATGTGKEGLARLVHDQSPRRDGPLVAVNCAALADSMLEAALFGHERGAFTGAQASAPGLIRAAHGGTLFLDEVAELPLAAQAKLLRALQEREVLPVGGTRAVAVDFRLVAAGNRDLMAQVAAGQFRADLYHRLAVFPLRTLPLAQRRADIPGIAAHWLLAKGDGPLAWISAKALQRLDDHDWPGNVRELGNVLDRALILGDGQRIESRDLLFDRAPPAVLGSLARLEQMEALGSVALPALVREHEHHAIRRVLANSPSRRAAARELGISERTLRYKLAGWRGQGLDPAADAPPMVQ